tara:strand:+ start:711 stop:2246 length:1536 start_codon:yes stop_codon:yes gene_type:complete
MHYITSNFNLINTNSAWISLKKKGAIIDNDFANFHLNLSKNDIINKSNSFHVIIFCTKNNIKEIFEKIKSLKKTIYKHSYKPYFFYFFVIEKSKINEGVINSEIKKLKKLNLFFNIFFLKKKDFYSSRNHKIIKFPFDINAIHFFSKAISKRINQIYIKPYKLIILDCDNTLWGGILDEDKESEISYKSKIKKFYYETFQKKIKDLKEKGYLLAICSKNNEKKVWKIFKNKNMHLQKKDFITYQINWDEKTDNISKIVKNLNLRYEDCIFIDDNKVEIEKVKKTLKKLNTLHLRDIEKFEDVMIRDQRLNKILISQDDIKKQKQYKLKSKFNNYVRENVINHNLIKGLRQKVKIFNCSLSKLKRAEELFNKTNQFNFTLNRYNANKILELNRNDNCEIKLFELNDKFGYHGIIGAYVLKVEKKNILITDFVLSCRVLSRFVEDYILYYISKKYETSSVHIRYNKTNINSNLIPIFLKKDFFSLKNKKKNIYLYSIDKNKKTLHETKKLFRS